jgi:hypothetical protein
MREELLHFIWKYKQLQLQKLETTNGMPLSIVEVGVHNFLSGPDFFNSQLRIDGQLWAGNVEIHLRSSDWYAHHHEEDMNYNNVILHVVWEDDAPVFRSDNTLLPTLELKGAIPLKLLDTYRALLSKRNKHFINCERNIGGMDGFFLGNWLERLYFERLERKSNLIDELLQKSRNNWEQVLFIMLLKSFGSKINGEAFQQLAERINFSIVSKTRTRQFQLESLFYGMAGLLEDVDQVDPYFLQLKKEYGYLSNKFDLDNGSVPRPEFFKLRPSNFPTIRLSQAASLYAAHSGLFSKLMEAPDLESLHALFGTAASSYWDTHFTFGKVSRKSVKKLSRKFIDLLVINTVLPLKFCHAKYLGKEAGEKITALVSNLPAESNSILSHFQGIGVLGNNAMEGQALLELYNNYCSQNKCLQCAVGSRLLRGNN